MGTSELTRLRHVSPAPPHPAIMADDIVLPIPNLDLPQQLFLLANHKFAKLHPDATKQLLAGIKADSEHYHTGIFWPY